MGGGGGGAMVNLIKEVMIMITFNPSHEPLQSKYRIQQYYYGILTYFLYQQWSWHIVLVYVMFGNLINYS